MPQVRGAEGKLTLRERGKLDKRDRIRAAGVELFKQKDFDEVTTKELAERAGVGEATLFRYVNSKLDLLLTIYGDRMEAILHDIEVRDSELARSCRDAREYLDRVYAIYEARAAFYREDPGNAALYLREAFRAGSELGTRAVIQGDRCIRLTAEILRDAQNAGVIYSGVDTKIVGQNCHGIFIHEVDRTPVRGFTPESITTRVLARLAAQLEPLVASTSTP
jgi:AcrR family transcriptional regulator